MAELPVEKVIFARRLGIDVQNIQTTQELDRQIFDKLISRLENLETDVKYLVERLLPLWEAELRRLKPDKQKEEIMRETPNLEYLKYLNSEIKKLAHLLKNPEPGLFSWCLMYNEAMVNVARFWNYDKPDVPEDWTGSNCSNKYLHIVSVVAGMLVSLRLGCNVEKEARAIVSTLAHKEGLAPREGKQVDKIKGGE